MAQLIIVVGFRDYVEIVSGNPCYLFLRKEGHFLSTLKKNYSIFGEEVQAGKWEYQISGGVYSLHYYKNAEENSFPFKGNEGELRRLLSEKLLGTATPCEELLILLIADTHTTIPQNEQWEEDPGLAAEGEQELEAMWLDELEQEREEEEEWMGLPDGPEE